MRAGGRFGLVRCWLRVRSMFVCEFEMDERAVCGCVVGGADQDFQTSRLSNMVIKTFKHQDFQTW